MTASAPAPDVRAYLGIRSATPSGFNHDGSRLLVSSDLPGTSQVHRLDLPPPGTDLATRFPVPVERLVQLTDDAEPTGAGYLPTVDRLLVSRDTGGNERHQLYLRDDAPAGRAELTDLVVDPDHIHRPGGVSRDGRLLAYATNRRTGTDFDVWVRDLATGDEELVHAPGGWAGAAGFSPAATYLTVWELTERAADNRCFLLDRRDGTLLEIAPHEDLDDASVGAPSWLPDESAFFCATDVGRDVPAIHRGRIVDGAVELECVLEPGWPCGAAIDWTGRHLLVTWNEEGRSRARLHDPATLEPVADLPLPGDGVAGGYRFSQDGRRLCFGFSSARIPGDVWLVDLDDGPGAAGGLRATRLTVSPSGVDEAGFVDPELVHFPAADGLDVPAFLYRPAGTGPEPAPVVVRVHGGPESQYRPSFAGLVQYLIARGYAVVAPNVRGSTGYGKAYQHLDDRELRLDAVADLAALHDWLADREDLDADRAVLWGGSYGGYMVLAGLAFQPERWAAGVDIVGISNLVTFLERTAPWRRAFREREYGSLATDRELLLAASPITHIDRMRAPLFIIHGANDPRVPVGEAEQIHAALTERGIRCELAIYDDEGHGLAKLGNRIDAYPRVAAFLDEVV